MHEKRKWMQFMVEHTSEWESSSHGRKTPCDDDDDSRLERVSRCLPNDVAPSYLYSPTLQDPEF